MNVISLLFQRSDVMTHQRMILMGTLTALVLLPAAALPWRAWNRHEVLPVGNGVYEVVSRIGSGAQDYWCAIGDYAIRQDRVAATQRIYVWQAIGPSETRPNRKGVQFAYRPPAGSNTETGYSLTVRQVGDNLNAATARQYCYDLRDSDPWRRFP